MGGGGRVAAALGPDKRAVREVNLNVLSLTYFLILKRRAFALFSLMEASLT